MEIDSIKLLRLALPSLCLFYSVSGPSLSSGPERKEAFGSKEYYLALRLDGIPRRSIAGQEVPENLGFSGVFATEKAEHPIQGKRVRVGAQTWYLFNTPEGRFVGWLTKSDKGCEPILQFRIENSNGNKQQGKMAAGFCDQR